MVARCSVASRAATRMGKNEVMADYAYRFERPRVLSMVLAGGEGK